MGRGAQVPWKSDYQERGNKELKCTFDIFRFGGFYDALFQYKYYYGCKILRFPSPICMFIETPLMQHPLLILLMGNPSSLVQTSFVHALRHKAPREKSTSLVSVRRRFTDALVPPPLFFPTTHSPLVAFIPWFSHIGATTTVLLSDTACGCG